MELFRNQLDKQASGIFEQENPNQLCVKVNTQIFDSTLPSELEFDEPQNPPIKNQIQKLKEKSMLDIFQSQSLHSQARDPQISQPLKKQEECEYQLMTKSIINFTFKRSDDNGLIIRQIQHRIGSFIPYQIPVKTFEVKFFDELSELANGVSKFKLLWKSVVGYVKTQLFIKNGYVYLLERKKEGFMVHSIWDLQNLFKLFSDRQEHKLRLIFRVTDKEEVSLVTKEIQADDLNLIAHIFEETKSLQIICYN